jgi:hypothetical protein
MAARLTGARTLVHVHDLNDPGVMLGALQGLLARPTDTAVCPERVCVARNGIPEALRQAGAGARSQVRAELDIEAGRPVLAVIGDGPERPACEALTRALGVSGHVSFLGKRSDVPRLLAAIEAPAAARPVARTRRSFERPGFGGRGACAAPDRLLSNGPCPLIRVPRGAPAAAVVN